MMERKFCDEEKRQWSFGPFIRSEFPDEYSQIDSLFSGELNEIFPSEIRSQLRD
jgi:hypothetical protein